MTSPVRIISRSNPCYLSLVSPPVAYWLNVRIFPAPLQDQFRNDTHPLPCPYCRAAVQRHELAALHHSITSSAATSRTPGTVRPSEFAVFRLSTVSNLL